MGLYWCEFDVQNVFISALVAFRELPAIDSKNSTFRPFPTSYLLTEASNTASSPLGSFGSLLLRLASSLRLSFRAFRAVCVTDLPIPRLVFLLFLCACHCTLLLWVTK
jgi:hypothetical protein